MGRNGKTNSLILKLWVSIIFPLTTQMYVDQLWCCEWGCVGYCAVDVLSKLTLSISHNLFIVVASDLNNLTLFKCFFVRLSSFIIASFSAWNEKLWDWSCVCENDFCINVAPCKSKFLGATEMEISVLLGAISNQACNSLVRMCCSFLCYVRIRRKVKSWRLRGARNRNLKISKALLKS